MANLKTLRIADFSRDVQYLTAGDNITIVNDVISAVVPDLTNYYTKDDTYSKTEVNDLISAIDQFKVEVVSELPATGEEKTIYLVPKSTSKTNNARDEYLWINNAWELIGDTAVDLTGYYTSAQVDALLDDKVDAVAGKGLSTNDYTDADKAVVNGIATTYATKAEIADFITCADLGDCPTITAMQTDIDGKQDALTAGNNIAIANDGTISATDTTYQNATTTEAGLMSAADKTKLDGLSELTKANILAALGYEEIQIAMTDTDGATYTKTILAKIDE